MAVGEQIGIVDYEEDELLSKVINRPGYYMTTEGTKPCHIIRYFSLYGEEYAEIIIPNGKTQVKKWKVTECR